jgi:subtilisin family serine protease
MTGHRVPVLLAVVALGIALAVPSPASADAATYPPTIGPIVTGDVTGYQWMLPATNAEAAHAQATGAGITVAIIDTGVDASHPDLEGRVLDGAIVQADDVTGKPELVPATVAETSDDWYGHGSHVAGIVAADDDGDGVTGIAPDAQILPIDVEPRRSPVRTAAQYFTMVSVGIDYAVAAGADVVNLSLGGVSSGIAPSKHTQRYLDALDALCASVDSAVANGTVVVAAAGNSGDWGNPEAKPAACPGAVTVAALGPSLDRTFWSSFDAAVDLSAPGEDILSVDSTVAELSPTPHTLTSGTSMAAPVVTGVAALVMERHPTWDAEQVANHLTATAMDLGVTGRDPDTGFGIVDAAAAVGAPAPTPARQMFFATWGEMVWGGDADDAVISWTTPDVEPVTGYTVTVHTDTGTTDYPVSGLTVRADVELPDGAWWTVTAHSAEDDVTTYPQARLGGGAGDRPERLRDIGMRRTGDRLHIRWSQPAEPTDIDVIRAQVRMKDPNGSASGRLVVDQTRPFPDGMTVPLPHQARWSDIRLALSLVNRDDDGRTIGGRWQEFRGGSPAVYGSHVEWVAATGRRTVEVEGHVSDLNAQRVCDNHTCAREPATLVVDRGQENERIDVRYSTRGTFHTTLTAAPGIEVLRLRIFGPKTLDSGPFVRVRVQR